ncbi:MAG: hypothetical protein ACYCQJ_08600 [Nitrososphaerales archaeon]
MSKLIAECSLSGIHSRSESLVKTSRDYDRGRADLDALNAEFSSDAAKLIELQVDSRFSNFSDGQLRWQDFIRPFSESVNGLESGADLSRWFDTNTFYKKPTVKKRLDTDGTFLQKKGYSFGADKSANKVSLPGPYTLSRLVDDQFYNSSEELVHAFASVLKKVISSLIKEGYSSIQLNEPSLVFRYGKSALTEPHELQAFIDAFSDNLSSTNVDLTLHTYFGDCSSILEKLLALEGISTIGIDFTQTPLENLHCEFEDKALGCGCVDARSSFIESPEWIRDFGVRAAAKLNCSKLRILPSSDLKYLPRAYADQKISAIGAAARLLGSGI